MKKNYPVPIIIVVILLAGASTVSAQAVGTGIVNINNVNAGFSSIGNFFTSSGDNNGYGAQGYSLYQVPKDTDKRAVKTAAIWMSGFDTAGNLHLAAQTDFKYGKDYFPGPIGDTLSSEVQYCHQVFQINRTTINQFEGLSFPTSWNLIDSSILSWPAYGNTYLDTFQNVQITNYLAPFVDVDNDGIYNPLKGDYPDFCGDQAVFFVYNDSAAPHSETGGSILGFEVRVLASEFVNRDTNGVFTNAKTAVNNTVFLHMDIENKSQNNYSNFNLGLFEAPDLGCYNNDRVGCDTNRNLMFVYMGTTPPPCGIFSYAPYQAAHGVIMLNQMLGDFVYYIDGAVAAQSDPVTIGQYEYYLTGYWADGTPFTNGGTGYGGNVPTNFCFPGDPNDTAQWSEATVAAMEPGDRRMMGSIGNMNFNINETKHFDFAFVTSYDSTGTMDGMVDTLKRDADSVQAFYNNVIAPCQNALATGIKSLSSGENLSLFVFPNPAHNQITIQAAANIQSLKLTDVEGRVVLQLGKIPGNYTIDVSQFAKGVYILNVRSGDQYAVKKIVVE